MRKSDSEIQPIRSCIWRFAISLSIYRSNWLAHLGLNQVQSELGVRGSRSLVFDHFTSTHLLARPMGPEESRCLTRGTWFQQATRSRSTRASWRKSRKQNSRQLMKRTSSGAFYPSVQIGVERWSRSTIFLLFHPMMKRRKRTGWCIWWIKRSGRLS